MDAASSNKVKYSPRPFGNVRLNSYVTTRAHVYTNSYVRGVNASVYYVVLPYIFPFFSFMQIEEPCRLVARLFVDEVLQHAAEMVEKEEAKRFVDEILFSAWNKVAVPKVAPHHEVVMAASPKVTSCSWTSKIVGHLKWDSSRTVNCYVYCLLRVDYCNLWMLDISLYVTV